MKKKILILTAIILAFVLTACGDITINIPEGLLDKLVATGTPTPTQEPDDPTGTPDPTEEVTPTPTEEVTPTPTEEMTPTPTEKPTPTPTEKPTPTPTEEPTPIPTKVPTKTPTKKPTPTLVVKPTKVPTLTPTPTLKDEDDPDNIFPTSEELWEKLFGCWAADNDRFVYFTYTDAGPSFLAGIWERPIPNDRDEAVASKTIHHWGDGLYSIGITYPVKEETGADKPLTYTIMVDISKIDYRIIYVQAPDEEEMLEYTWMAYSYSDAYDEFTSFEPPTLEEVQSLWRNLSGYWYGPDNTYVVFDQMDSNTFLFDYGILETETRGYAYLEKIQTPIGAHPMRIVFYYPEHESELMGYLPREFVQLFLELDNIGKGNIAMKIGENGLWNTYIYAGW